MGSDLHFMLEQHDKDSYPLYVQAVKLALAALQDSMLQPSARIVQAEKILKDVQEKTEIRW